MELTHWEENKKITGSKQEDQPLLLGNERSFLMESHLPL